MLRLGRRLKTPLLMVRCLIFWSLSMWVMLRFMMVWVVIVRTLMRLLLRRGIRLMGIMLLGILLCWLMLLTVEVARLVARGFANGNNITDSRLEFSFDEILHERWDFFLWL